MEPFYIGTIGLVLWAIVCEVFAQCSECSGTGSSIGYNVDKPHCRVCRGSGLVHWRRKR